MRHSGDAHYRGGALENYYLLFSTTSILPSVLLPAVAVIAFLCITRAVCAWTNHNRRRTTGGEQVAQAAILATGGVKPAAATPA